MFNNLILVNLMHILLNKRLFLSNRVSGVLLSELFLDMYILFDEQYCTFCGQTINLANIK